MRKPVRKHATPRRSRKPTRAQARANAGLTVNREAFLRKENGAVPVNPSPLAEDAGAAPALTLSATLQERLDSEDAIATFLRTLRICYVGVLVAQGAEPHHAEHKAAALVRATGLEKPELNEIDRAPHYNATKFETIEVLDDWDVDPYRWQIIKYLSRLGLKTPDVLTDLKKAQYYLNRLVRLTENGEGPLGHG